MSEEFKIEIVNPEKSFLVKEDVSEVVVPAFEGEMGILKDHISIISFLKPGIIKILSKSGDENYYVEDGIVEFKNNNLSILTSSIFNLTDLDKILTIPGFKNEIIEIWSLSIPISPSKAGTTTSETSSLTKKDFSGFTISILNSSLIKRRLP
jgi:F-type H+-transporting ATPase subunit epsilon/F-type H+-transporting ATPase subunit delta